MGFVQRFLDAVRRPRLSKRAAKALEKAPTPPSQALAFYRDYASRYAARVRGYVEAELKRNPVDWAALERRIADIPVRAAARRAGRLAQRHAIVELERSLGKPVPRSKSGDAAVLEAFVNEQERLFARIAADQIRMLREAVELNYPDPLARLWVSRNRSLLVAGDQSHKIFNEAMAYYGPSMGAGSFLWVSRDDSRVRPKHHAVHGKVFSWTDPPPVGRHGERYLPGQDAGCRCVSAPVPDP